MRKLILVIAFLLFCSTVSNVNATAIFTTIDHPAATGLTDIWGIDGQGRLVGNFVGASGWQPYIYDGTTWINPSAPGTFIGADEDKIVGNYFTSNERGFILDNSGWSDIKFPSAPNTEVYDVDGDQIVGKYYTGSTSHGFLFDGSSWNTIDAPGASKTIVTGVDGNTLAGNYFDASGWHSFLYDGINWTTIDSVSGHPTVWGVQGETVVGYYDSHGFKYDGNTWSLIDVPGAAWTQVTGIEGSTVFGKYMDESSIVHGFTYAAVPEPYTISIDIKPQSCPNPLNVKSKGVLPVAILGTADLDVTDIDIASLRLYGVAPVKSEIEDVTAPAFKIDPCDCEELDEDSFEDLVLKFNKQEIITALNDKTILTLTGNLLDGTAIEGSDCVVIKGVK